MNSKQLQKAMLLRVAGLAMALVATVAFISGCSRGFADTARVVSAEEGTLTVAAEDGANQETHEVATDAEVTLDGQPAAMANESFSGKISSLGDGDLVITDDNEAEHTFAVNDDTKYTLDGNDAAFDDLKVTYSVNVTAEKDGDNYVAKSVDATSDSSS